MLKYYFCHKDVISFWLYSLSAVQISMRCDLSKDVPDHFSSLHDTKLNTTTYISNIHGGISCIIHDWCMFSATNTQVCLWNRLPLCYKVLFNSILHAQENQRGWSPSTSNVQRNLNPNENLIAFEIILWLTHLDIPTSFYYLVVHCGGLVVVRVNPLISWPGTAGQRNPTSIDLASRHPSDPSGTSFQRVASNHLVRERGF